MPVDSFKRKCNYCLRKVGRQNLRACSRCQMVRYCSKECQREAWKDHKHRCSTALRDSLADDPEQDAMNKALTKWINFWRGTIFSWALWALEIANNPPDRLATHWFVIQIEKRPKPSNSAQYFEMVGGEIMDADEVLQVLREGDCFAEQIEQWQSDRRGNETVQIIIICESLLRFLWYSLRKPALEAQRSKPTFARALADGWQDKLIDIIDSGDVSRSDAHSMAAAIKAFPPPS